MKERVNRRDGLVFGPCYVICFCVLSNLSITSLKMREIVALLIDCILVFLRLDRVSEVSLFCCFACVLWHFIFLFTLS